MTHLDSTPQPPPDAIPETTPRHPDRGHKYTPWLMFIVALAVYGLFPTQNWNYADDSLNWAGAMRRGEGLIHHHHLYLNAMRWIYHLVTEYVGIFENPARFLSFYSALTGAMGLLFLCKLLRCLQCSKWAMMGAVLCGTTAGYWSYAMVGDVYVPAIAFMIAGLYFTCRGLAIQTGSSWRSWAPAVLCYFLMLAHHQAFAFIVIGLCPAILLIRCTSLNRRLAGAIGLPLATGLCTLGLYGLIYQAQPASHQQGFGRFISGYVSQFKALPDMKQLSLSSMVNAGAGCTRAMLSTNFLFKSQAIAHAVQSRFPYRHVHPYPYLVRGIPWPLIVITGISFIFALIVIAILGACGLWHGLHTRGLAAVILIAAIPQSLFFLWWEGISDEFWLWSTPVISLVVVLGARALPKRGGGLLLALTAAVALSTFISTVYPILYRRFDIDWVNRRFMTRLTANDALIAMNELTTSGQIELACQEQGFDFLSISGEAIPKRPFDMDKLQAFINRTLAKGGTIYIDPYVEEAPKSYLRMIRFHNKHFKQDWPRIREILHNIDSAHVRWMPMVATVPGFFERQPAPGPGATIPEGRDPHAGY